eukprot:scaffold258236_cov18-Tisochrysis_lutea.AAC.1
MSACMHEHRKYLCNPCGAPVIHVSRDPHSLTPETVELMRSCIRRLFSSAVRLLLGTMYVVYNRGAIGQRTTGVEGEGVVKFCEVFPVKQRAKCGVPQAPGACIAAGHKRPFCASLLCEPRVPAQATPLCGRCPTLTFIAFLLFLALAQANGHASECVCAVRT